MEFITKVADISGGEPQPTCQFQPACKLQPTSWKCSGGCINRCHEVTVACSYCAGLRKEAFWFGICTQHLPIKPDIRQNGCAVSTSITEPPQPWEVASAYTSPLLSVY